MYVPIPDKSSQNRVLATISRPIVISRKVPVQVAFIGYIQSYKKSFFNVDKNLAKYILYYSLKYILERPATKYK